MDNPFIKPIIDKMTSIENRLSEFPCKPFEPVSIEIIDRKELCKRLQITVPTAIRWGNKGSIPSFTIGSSVRYNWPRVIETLESKKERRAK